MQLYVAAGKDHDLNTTWFDPKYFRVTDKIIQNSTNEDDHIILLHLKTPFDFGEATNIYPVCFFNKLIVNLDDELFFAGYGKQEKRYVEIKNLKSRKVKSQDKFEFRDVFTFKPKLLKTKLTKSRSRKECHHTN